MSAAVAEIKPKYACKSCGKPFEPEEGQEICDDCQARRRLLWIVLLTLLLVCALVGGPSLVRWWTAPPPPLE